MEQSKEGSLLASSLQAWHALQLWFCLLHSVS